MVLLIIGIVLALAGVAAFVMFKEEDKTIANVCLFGGLAIFAGCIIGGCIKSVPTGHTGVVTSFGKVEDYTFEAGINFDAPWKKVIKMDNRTQKQTITLSCFSSDIQAVDVIYTVNYRIDKENAQHIYKTIGTDYFNLIVSPKIAEAVKDVFAKYNAEELIESRTIVSKQIETALTDALTSYNIVIDSASIENIDFTDSFTNAVEAKQVAEQNKLKAATEQEQKIIEAEAEAERKVIEAQAASDTAIIAAQADAEVAKIAADSAEYQGQKDAAIMSNLGEMLNKYPDLIDYYYSQNWNGELPTTFVGEDGGLPVINIK